MKSRGMLYVAGAVAATAIGFSPAAAADEFFPPGTDQIGDRTYITDLFEQPFFRYAEWYAPYEVLDGDESLGQFTNTSTYFVAPYQPWGIWTVFNSDVISDSSYEGLSDGATHADLSFSTITFPYLQTLLFSAEYYDNPGIGTSFDISFFGGPDIPIWDITYDPAVSATTDFGDLFGADAGGLGGLLDLGGLLGIDPGTVTDFLGLDPGALGDLAGLL